MACFDLRWVSLLPDGTRKYGLHPEAASYRQIPCGKSTCVGCMGRKVTDWRSRLLLQAYAQPPAICLTLTYSPDQLPPYGSLRKADAQDFLRRFRRLSGVQGVKFHLIGEYSPAPAQRPHIHASLFGVGDAVNDREPYNRSKADHPQFRSRLIDDAWRHRGLATFQYYGPGAASYVAGHEASKGGGRKVYGLDLAGRPVLLEPEFMLASRGKGGGIGRAAYDAYGAQLRAQDAVILPGGAAFPVPRLFDRYTAEAYPERYAELQAKREAKRIERETAQPLEQQPDRLSVREELALLDRVRRAKQRTLR